MTELEDLARESLTWSELDRRRVAAERRQLRRRLGTWFAEGMVVAIGTWLWSRSRRPTAKVA